MEGQSVWQREQRDYPRLQGEIERDIVVIGGGIAGFLAAFRLAEAGLDVTLLEADRLFSGTTGKTTAKISRNQGTIYADLALRYGTQTAALYYAAQDEGQRGFLSLIERYAIECDLRQTDSFVFSQGTRSALEYQAELLRSWKVSCKRSDSLQPFQADCALQVEGEYLFDPLRFLTALPVNFEIFEQTRAVDIDGKRGEILTDEGRIRAKRIVIATHYPVINSRGGYLFKLRQSLSYTIAIDKTGVEGMYLDAAKDGISVRPYAGGTLIGGEDHRTGRSGSGGQFAALEERAKALFGPARVTHRWCAEDVMTFDGMPMVGRYAPSLPQVYVITGFNKWGMTNAMVCASVLTDLILERENPYARLFSPQRHCKGAFADFVSNLMTNLKYIGLGYLRITVQTDEEIPKGSGKVVRYRGKRRAVYRDYDGKKYVIGRMCPHFHGELQWNAEAHTWDCPCHGSRFDCYGNLLSEPSKKSCRCDCERE